MIATLAQHGHGAAPVTGGTGEVVVRVLLLTASALVAGIGVLAPVSGPAGAARRVVTWTAAGVVVLVAVPAINQADMSVPVLAGHIVLVLLVPALLAKPPAMSLTGTALGVLVAVEATATHEGAALWLGLAHMAAAVAWLGAVAVVATAPGPAADRPATEDEPEPAIQRAADAGSDVERGTLVKRLAPLAVLAGVVVAGTGVLQANLAGAGFDVRLVDTAFGLVLLAKSLLLLGVGAIAVVAVRKRVPRGAFRFATAGLAAALGAGAVLAAVPVPVPLPATGVPLLRDVALGGAVTPILISPHRPGRNLVHVDGEGVLVGTDPARLTEVTSRPGTTGGWTTVDLPPGTSTLFVRKGEETQEVRLDTGTEKAPASATGVDGPECASFALGALLAGQEKPLTACPADALDGRDEESVRGLLSFLTGRGLGSVAVLSDSSPRAKQAEKLVQATGVPVVGVETGRADALVVLSGWAPAASELAKIGARQQKEAIFPHGVYLAPWLLNPPVITSVASVILPLRFNPHEQLPATYAQQVGARFAGEAATAAGYRGWLTGQTDSAKKAGDTVPALYTASLVSILPKEFQHHDGAGWLPNGTVVAVSGPLVTQGGNP